MKSAKFKIGDKVKIPYGKKPTSCHSLEECSAYRSLPKGQDFFYIYEVGNTYIGVGSTPESHDSGFKPKDLELYTEEIEYEIY